MLEKQNGQGIMSKAEYNLFRNSLYPNFRFAHKVDVGGNS